MTLVEMDGHIPREVGYPAPSEMGTGAVGIPGAAHADHLFLRPAFLISDHPRLQRFPVVKSRFCLPALCAIALFAAVWAAPAPGQDTDGMTRRQKQRTFGKQRRVGDLRVGDRAPDFTLKSVDGSETVQLSAFEGNRDVVLIFGSYT